MVISELRKTGKKRSKKDLEKFGDKEKSATFAPAISTSSYDILKQNKSKRFLKKKLKKDLDCKE